MSGERSVCEISASTIPREVKISTHTLQSSWECFPLKKYSRQLILRIIYSPPLLCVQILERDVELCKQQKTKLPATERQLAKEEKKESYVR